MTKPRITRHLRKAKQQKRRRMISTIRKEA
jgi:hypothetical protein